MLANGGYLLELVEEFLDLARLEADARGDARQVVSVGPLLRELAESFALLVRTKPVRFVADLSDPLPGVVAEPAKLRVVLQNLLQNAAKFTERGEIRLEAGATDGGDVVVRVCDTGPGIAPEHHEAVFDVFRQLRSHGGSAKGVGLGLALARRFARMMGGEITLASTPGEGSTFTVRLPGAGAAHPRHEAAA